MKPYIYIVFLTLLLVGCRSTKDVAKVSAPLSGEKAEKYKHDVLLAAPLTDAVTAKMKFSLEAAGKEISVNGSLRMKRGEVVQLSLTMLGFEIGRLEFSPEDVLVMDRYHKQYVRCRYDEIDFLRSADIDFYVLQSLFWNELFVPGTQKVDEASLGQFSVYDLGDTLQLQLNDTPRLVYNFVASKTNARIHRVEVKDAMPRSPLHFVAGYTDFDAFASGFFPKKLSLTLRGAGKDATANFAFSRLSNSSDWETHTTPSSKYKQLSLDAVFGAVSRMLK